MEASTAIVIHHRFEVGDEEKKNKGEGLAEGYGVCAICLERILIQEVALVKGCEHAYCVTCILRWATYHQDPSCPQCRHPFNSLNIHRSLDGCIHDYMFEESVCLLLRACWFVPLAAETNEGTPEEPDDLYQYYAEGQDDDDDDYFGSSSSSNIRIGNRRWGDNGYVRAGRKEACPVNRQTNGGSDAGPSRCPKKDASPKPNTPKNPLAMAGQSRKWMILVATLWIQAFTGTNFDFSAYSSQLKSVMGISQMQLNYLATASDLGKIFGWSSGIALLYLPLPVVLFISAALGFASYGAQWLLITSRITLPYLPVFLLCLLAGCSICWFNTVCFVLCIRNFPVNRSLALALSVSFNGVSAALYSLAANALSAGQAAASTAANSSSYLLLNAVLPLLASTAALPPILRPPPSSTTSLPPDGARRDSHAFLLLNLIAFLTGLYLLLLNSVSSSSSDPLTGRLLFAGAILLLILPLGIPGLVYARDWYHRNIHASFASIDEELQKELLDGMDRTGSCDGEADTNVEDEQESGGKCSCDDVVLGKDRISVLGEEHGLRKLVTRVDFWLYYLSYFCGATVGLVYSNNLGQIAQSLGRQKQTSMLITVYSSCSFFGRLVSAAPEFLRGRVYFARTGWLAVALVPTPLALFLMAKVDGGDALLAGTALVGLSSGFIFAAAVSVTAELFGPGSVAVNHNILITNIPLGSLLYGLLAALVYDANSKLGLLAAVIGDGRVCMGARCYAKTFWAWVLLSTFGLACSVALYLRTRTAYGRAERSRVMAEIHGQNYR